MDHITQSMYILWDYLRFDQPITSADAICVLGSDSTRVAEYAASIWHEGYAPYIIVSGGQAHRSHEGKSEAERDAAIIVARGVPEDRIFIEPTATNTGENVLYIKNLIERESLPFQSLILVQKPYMGRRVYATFKKVWPEATCIITSPRIELDSYIYDQSSQKRLISYLMNTLVRIKEYPEKGFQIYQEIPPHVQEAYDTLFTNGYRPST